MLSIALVFTSRFLPVGKDAFGHDVGLYGGEIHSTRTRYPLEKIGDGKSTGKVLGRSERLEWK